jgi:hypothetical protein
MPNKRVPKSATASPNQAIMPTEPAVEKPQAVFGKDALPAGYSDERIQAAQDIAALVGDIGDEWYGQISTTDPFYEVARPYIEKYPEKHFRFLSDPHCLRRTTRGYQPVYDKRGRAVECAGQRLAWIPRAEFERRNALRADKATSALSTAKENYAEHERRAMKDSAGAIEILPDESERFVGSRRVAV